MPIKVQCACGKAFAAKDELAGKTVKCPGCQNPLKIPGGVPNPAKASDKPAAAKPGAAKPAAAKPAPGKPATGAAPSRPAPAAPAARGGADLFDEVGLQAPAADTRPCPGCTEPMPIKAVVCIKCGYNTMIGRRMQTIKVGSGDDGPVGHGAVAQDLLDKAAKVIDDDAAEEVKKTKEGMPWWVYLIGLAILIGCATAMLMFRSEKEPPKDGKRGSVEPGSRQAARYAGCIAAVHMHGRA